MVHSVTLMKCPPPKERVDLALKEINGIALELTRALKEVRAGIERLVRRLNKGNLHWKLETIFSGLSMEELTSIEEEIWPPVHNMEWMVSDQRANEIILYLRGNFLQAFSRFAIDSDFEDLARIARQDFLSKILAISSNLIAYKIKHLKDSPDPEKVLFELRNTLEAELLNLKKLNGQNLFPDGRVETDSISALFPDFTGYEGGRDRWVEDMRRGKQELLEEAGRLIGQRTNFLNFVNLRLAILLAIKYTEHSKGSEPNYCPRSRVTLPITSKPQQSSEQITSYTPPHQPPKQVHPIQASEYHIQPGEPSGSLFHLENTSLAFSDRLASSAFQPAKRHWLNRGGHFPQTICIPPSHLPRGRHQNSPRPRH